ncbi:hypothetical protein [Streptococcus minor]|uniref:hypothetical protein n=1 Tax=Streptococcus minor TaxID=229549 RepID=UPI0003604CBD|nr:hypothetical protein [Streptococcus minor]
MVLPIVIDDGKTEHFTKNVLFKGYKGNKGSRMEPALFGGYKVVRYDGHRESARI